MVPAGICHGAKGSKKEQKGAMQSALLDTFKGL
jgi:hypothetical protein